MILRFTILISKWYIGMVNLFYCVLNGDLEKFVFEVLRKALILRSFRSKKTKTAEVEVLLAKWFRNSLPVKTCLPLASLTKTEAVTKIIVVITVEFCLLIRHGVITPIK